MAIKYDKILNKLRELDSISGTINSSQVIYNSETVETALDDLILSNVNVSGVTSYTATTYERFFIDTSFGNVIL